MGVLAVGVNMAYLTNKTENVKTVKFIGIRPGQTIPQGTSLSEGHVEEVPVPIHNAANLEKFAHLWDERALVIGRPVTRALNGGDLVMLEDTRTPPIQLQLEKGEVLLPVEVGTRSPLIEPGDDISFIVPIGPTTPAGPLRHRVKCLLHACLLLPACPAVPSRFLDRFASGPSAIELLRRKLPRHIACGPARKIS